MPIARLEDTVRAVLSPDLLSPKWRKAALTGNPLAGHCYASSEAMYHLMGGAEAGWVPQILGHDAFPEGLAKGETHWFLKNKLTGEIVDPTEGQFAPLQVPHSRGKGCGFLTGRPSRRAAAIINRVVRTA